MHVFPTFDAGYCGAWLSLAISNIYLVLTGYDSFEFSFMTLNQKVV